MIRLFVLITLSILLSSCDLRRIPLPGSVVHPLNENHLKQLKKTKVCPNCSLNRANLKREHLEGANLEQCSCTYANFKRAHLQNANLKGSRLWNSDFRGANLNGANLEKAHMAMVTLEDATLQGANLTGAYLVGVELEGAKLKNAILKDAFLSLEAFKKGYLTGAKLEGAKFVSKRDASGEVQDYIYQNGALQLQPKTHSKSQPTFGK